MGGFFLIFSGSFYAFLCFFSIVTGYIYVSGKRDLNPLELSEKTIRKLNTKEKQERFTKKMGWVTIIVGIIQGVTAYCIFKAGNAMFYYVALGFTIFSICSVAVKLKGNINTFLILKAIFYMSILTVLLLQNSRAMFFI